MGWDQGFGVKIRLQNGLPFVSVTVLWRGQRLELGSVLLDTGSVGTLFPTDVLSSVGIAPTDGDFVWTVRGIGGTESVFGRQVDGITVGELAAAPFEIEIGLADYGFGIQGILGMDFLTRVCAIVDLACLELRPGHAANAQEGDTQ